WRPSRRRREEPCLPWPRSSEALSDFDVQLPSHDVVLASVIPGVVATSAEVRPTVENIVGSHRQLGSTKIWLAPENSIQGDVQVEIEHPEVAEHRIRSRFGARRVGSGIPVAA